MENVYSLSLVVIIIVVLLGIILESFIQVGQAKAH